LFSPQELIPCDCVLISGEIYVNEASLTGENVPIGKFPAVSMANLNEDNCWLFEGAKILELRGIPIALVVNTGFASRKGRIFRKILHNNPSLP
jgi:cation-transporting ATPase 13A2